jgi:hypothetical protein
VRNAQGQRVYRPPDSVSFARGSELQNVCRPSEARTGVGAYWVGELLQPHPS